MRRIASTLPRKVFRSMVKTASTMLPLETKLPSFKLDYVKGIECYIDGSLYLGDRISSQNLPCKPLLLMVICAHCPFVKHIEKQLTSLFQEYGEKVQFIAISSNSRLTHPQDGPEYLLKQASSNAWTFPYLIDAEQELAKGLKAACTPDFFLFSPLELEVQTLQYRGQLDSSRPGNNEPVTGIDLRNALDSVLRSEKISFKQLPSIGCNIKWHPGKEPLWFA